MLARRTARSAERPFIPPGVPPKIGCPADNKAVTGSQNLDDQRRLQLAAAIDILPSALWSYDADGREVFMSAQWEVITGQTVAAWHRDGCLAIVHPDDRSRVEAAWERYVAGAECFAEQFRIIRADTGEERVLVEQGTYADGISGVALVGVTSDITLQVDALSQAAHRGAHVAAMLRAVPIAVWGHGTDGSLLFSNDRWQTYTGQTSPETAHRGWASVIHPDDVASVRSAWQHFEAGPPNGHLQHTFRVIHTRTGRERTLSEHGVYALDEAGQPIAIVGATYDATDEATNAAQLRAHVSELEALTATLPAIVWRFAPDGAVTYCSEQWRAFTGRDPESALGGGWKIAVHAEDVERVDRAWQGFVADGEPYAPEYRLVNVDGTERWVVDVVSPVLDAQGLVEHYVGTSFDITARRENEEQERARVRCYEALSQIAECALATADPFDQAVAILREALKGREVEVVSEHSGSDDDVSAISIEVLDDLPLAAGETALLEGATHLLAAAAARRSLEETLRHAAEHDPVTALPNRVRLMRELEAAIETAGSVPFAVLLCDLDNFKLHNDSFGHEMGDRILVAAAHRLASLIRPTDTLARMGGDEFVILCREVRREGDGALLARRIVEGFGTPLDIGGQQVHIGLSIGVKRMSRAADAEPASLLRDADAAMYAAKAQRRGSAVVFTEEMHERAVQRLAVETELRAGTSAGELALYYQPIVHLPDHAVIGFEALLRWQHPTRGLVLPGEFIAVAEETGQIDAIGRYVIDAAAAQASAWNTLRPDGPPLTISINVSGIQLAGHDLSGVIESSCATYGIEPSQLCIEITETVLFADVDSAVRALRALRGIGCEIWLDDFGTGYSSLAYVRRLPLTGIKLDRTFLTNITESAEDREIVRLVTAMANALDLAVTAEGVEQREHAAVLHELGCRRCQGYYFSRPLPPADARHVIVSGQPLALPRGQAA